MFRDWGGSFAMSPWIGQKSGAGIIIGAGPTITKYDFRRVPYRYKATVRAAYATSASTINAQFKGDYRFARRGMGIRWDAKAFLADAIHFFGLGNETGKTEVPDFYLMRQHMYRIEPALYQEFGKHGLVSIGPVFSRTVSDEDRPTLALEQRPYGFGSFSEFGALAGLLVDFRDDPVYPMLGFRVEGHGRYFPAMGDVEEPFGTVSGEVSGYLGTRKIPGMPVLAVRAGGAKGFGDLPFFEAPMLGGKPSLRGFSRERFNGDGSLYGSAELRLNLGHFKAVVPGEIGVYGLGDIGRVYRDGETSTLWHKSYGAGLWLSIYDRATTINLTWGHSVDGNKFYFASGFHF
jgi:outer membrane protein assembly factor BamA